MKRKNNLDDSHGNRKKARIRLESEDLPLLREDHSSVIYMRENYGDIPFLYLDRSRLRFYVHNPQEINEILLKGALSRNKYIFQYHQRLGDKLASNKEYYSVIRKFSIKLNYKDIIILFRDSRYQYFTYKLNLDKYSQFLQRIRHYEAIALKNENKKNIDRLRMIAENYKRGIEEEKNMINDQNQELLCLKSQARIKDYQGINSAWPSFPSID